MPGERCFTFLLARWCSPADLSLLAFPGAKEKLIPVEDRIVSLAPIHRKADCVGVMKG